MKKIKIIFVWTLIAIGLSFAALLFVDKVYLSSAKTFKINKVEEEDKKIKKTVSIDVPDYAENIKISYNGEYISYHTENKIVIINVSKKEEKYVEFKNGTVNYTAWLPDRNILFIGEKSGGNNGSFLALFSYDSEKNEKFQLEDENGKKTIINLPNNNYDIKNMTLSTATNTIYLKVKNEQGRSRIYRINTMAQLERIRSLGNNLGEIALMNSEDRVVYENKNDGNIHVEGKDYPITIRDEANHCLLGVDDKDVMYIGKLKGSMEEETIEKIYYWSLDEKTINKKDIELENPINKKDIKILPNGKIFFINNNENKVKELISKEEVKYNGVFEDISMDAIVSKEGNKVIIKPINLK
ncbi:hypothetical protein CJF15_05520 [Clostridium botulinum]|uniref:hypothetical protein n=1 Tax=Clostridium botulinum TaxID=1491 RepID=UPI0013FA040E|nr:hypothetical protein [Clostridium botulinum]MBN3408617.1 hypothetical protein [Clostridium botulinum]MBY6796350.1 hypothetical protein [Clostridium botulinum]MBY6864717.1 hypothetical protein [Clostridium botulinum]MBY6873601.1 hypothetical protein [Clostridium botulinum]MBY6887556.1 hypothetical protein [Clostridium botulinum]